MKVKGFVAALVALWVVAVAVAGCSEGSGSGGSSAGASAAAGVTSGNTRDPFGYAWATAAVGSQTGEAVSALAPLSSGAVLVARSPGGWLTRVAAGGALVQDGRLDGEVRAFVEHEGALYAATSDPSLPGAGDVHVRTAAGWSRSLDGAGSDAVVAVAHGRLFAALGDAQGGPTQVHVLSAQGWLTAGPLPRDGAPTAAAAFGTTLYVGLETPSGAALFARNHGVWTEVPLPAQRASAGERQRVTALVALPEALAVAVATFDATTGRATFGEVVLFDDSLAPLPSFTLPQDAPLTLTRQDATLYVGTASGRVLWRDGDGAFEDEPGLPTNGGVHALLADGSTLLVGAAGPAGPEVLRRVGLGAPAVKPAAQVPSGVTPVASASATPHPTWADVKAVLAASCAGCHSTRSSFRLSPNMTDDAADEQATRALIDPVTPEASPLLRKATNAEPHRGGAVLQAGTPEHATLLRWIAASTPPVQTNSPVQTTPPVQTAPAPATPAPVTSGTIAPVTSSGPPVQVVQTTYLADVKPVLAACVRCHATRSSFRLSPGLTQDAADYIAALGQVDLSDPRASAILLRPSSTAAHPVVALPAGSPAHDALLRWIEQGTTFK